MTSGDDAHINAVFGVVPNRVCFMTNVYCYSLPSFIWRAQVRYARQHAGFLRASIASCMYRQQNETDAYI